MSLESQIEAVLFWKGESVSINELIKILEVSEEEITNALNNFEKSLVGRGIALTRNGNEVMLYTSPGSSELIKKITKEDLNHDISKAGIEVLSLILYRGPIAKREIDYVRGVNSNYIVRNLLIRGLIEKADGADSRSFVYQPTLGLLAHLGINKKENLPNFDKVQADIATFMTSGEQEQTK